MFKAKAPLALRLYVGTLTLVWVGVLAYTTAQHVGSASGIGTWLVLSALFGLAEYSDLLFHHERGRLSLSPSESVLLPMIVVLSVPQVIWGVAIAVGVVAVLRWRIAGLKWFFNVSQYGLVAGLAAVIYQVLNGTDGSFTVRTALAATIAVVVFGVLSHVLVAGAISLAEKRSFIGAVRDVASTALVSLFGSIALGLLFAASLIAAEWTVVLLILPLGALYFSFRAVFRQVRERERVEHLHSASRALASSLSLNEALTGFLKAVAEIVSAREARAVVSVPTGTVWSAVRGGDVVADMEPLQGGPLFELLESLRSNPAPVIVKDEQDDLHRRLLVDLNAQNFVVVPLINDDAAAGCVLTLDRVGVEEFGEDDARILESLANELVLTLDSYRLFAQVAEERERFQQIFAGSKEGICLLDEDGIIRAWNPALARITGFNEEDIIGKNWSERVLVRDRYHRRIEGMDIITVPPDEELELVSRQGPPRWVAIMSGEVQSEDTRSWVILVRDITAEHELEESKSDFLSTISHELRTPLTTIKGSLQVLSRPHAGATSEVAKQMIEIMKRGSDRLERLVMNLLAVSQMEAGEVQVFPDEVPLEDMVRSRVVAMLADHPQVEITAQEDVVVRADRERLSQVVEHLLDNARKFGPESGCIQVTITKENGYARLSVADEGPGVPKIDQDRIFDRFVRLGHMLTRETQGPGVGLFIAKRSIEAMGGSITIESEPGEGATFHVRIPLARPMAAIESTSA